MQPNTYTPPVPNRPSKMKPILISLGIIFVVASLVVAGIVLWKGGEKSSTTVVPKAPTPVYITTTQLAVSWEKIEGATSYNLECATDAQFTRDISKATSQITNALCNDLKAGTPYWVRLNAAVPSGLTEWSMPVTLKTASIPVLITNLKATGISKSEVRLTWDASESVKTYDVQWASNQSFTTDLTNLSVTTNSATASFLNTATTYYFRVRPSNVDNPLVIVPYSTPISVKTK